MVGVHQRVGAPRLERMRGHGGPRSPRVGGHVQRELATPVAVDRRRCHPLTAEPTGLHRELGPVAGEEGFRCRGISAPSIRRPVLRRIEQPSTWDPCEEHLGAVVGTVPVATVTREILFEGVAEQVGVRRIAGDAVAVDRCHTGVDRRSEVEPGHRRRVVRGEVGGDGVPAEPVGGDRIDRVLRHLHPEHPQHAVVQLTAHRPEPAGERGGAVARLERLGPLRGTSVEQPETVAVLHESCVVHETGAVERGGSAGLVDERVLEQPQPAVAAEVVHVLVVPSEYGPDALGEEGVESGRRCVASTSDVGREVSPGGDGPTGRPRRRWCVGRRRGWLERHRTRDHGRSPRVLGRGGGDRRRRRRHR